MSNLLLKVPLLVTATGCFQLAVTPPNPVPSGEELVAPKTFAERVIHNARDSSTLIPKVLAWAASAAEILTILAQHDRLPAATPPAVLQYLARNRAISAVGLGASRTFLAGSLLAVAGGAIRYWCFRTLGRMFTFQLSIRRDHQLVTSGPYAVVRHPSYTGLMLVTVGINLCLLSPGSWVRESGVLETVFGKCCLAYWVAVSAAFPLVVMRAPREDELMKKQFGAQWEEWAKRVPYRLIPGIY